MIDQLNPIKENNGNKIYDKNYNFIEYIFTELGI